MACEQRTLVAISDVHVEVPENRCFVERLAAHDRGTWLIVCGDVGELMADVEWGLRVLAERFECVIWTPGNHELWTRPDDPLQLRGTARYAHLVERCRQLGVLTPEDPYPLWEGPGGPAVIAPLLTLYDYSFGDGGRSLGTATDGDEVVCTDELLLSPEPYASIADWCQDRVRHTEARLSEASAGGARLVLVSHFPLMEELTRPLRYPAFARWCGTRLTASWHRRFGAIATVYGHLHIPRSTVHDGVRFEEVSLGYPRQWRRPGLRQILPAVA